jgi:hypothetical protein
MGRTLAISLQVLLSSRMALSRFSSAGVHGVFVRCFFAGGRSGVASASAALTALAALALTGCETVPASFISVSWGAAAAGEESIAFLFFEGDPDPGLASGGVAAAGPELASAAGAIGVRGRGERAGGGAAAVVGSVGAAAVASAVAGDCLGDTLDSGWVACGLDGRRGGGDDLSMGS